MRIALIDLGAAPVGAMRELLAKHELSLVDGQVALEAFAGGYDGIVLMGSYDTDILDEAYMTRLAEAVRGTEVPVLGVGRGFQVCAASGMDVAVVADCEVAATKIVPTNDGAKIFQGSDPMLVKGIRRWHIDELPKNLQVLARSDTGIEAFRYKQRPVVAIQLGLEDFVYVSDGRLVLKNLLALFGRL
jgi:GMP synthase-like glutamine amidotransferase